MEENFFPSSSSSSVLHYFPNETERAKRKRRERRKQGFMSTYHGFQEKDTRAGSVRRLAAK